MCGAHAGQQEGWAIRSQTRPAGASPVRAIVLEVVTVAL
ncbi:hypothetical protein DVS28_a1252 [Euzebya pacifica]|uniref:Uncharacterized protein n=1 Tax=Euzebya pacifica TaxID=1608957 RepID=A0A346XUQ5_9ACTN|nr:hypothetical protein DVS28_a1252 [Euzebya pacifica]